MKLNEIRKLAGKKEYLTLYEEMISLCDKDGHTIKVWKYNQELDEFDEIPFEEMTKTIIEFLSKKIDVKDILSDLLKAHTPEQTVVDIYERVTKSNFKASVKSKEGCFSISIGGKKGRPVSLWVFPSF